MDQPSRTSKSRRQEALTLAEILLSEIELSTSSPVDILRKASRLARLLDDVDALSWLKYEVTGYPSDEKLPPEAMQAAKRSGRWAAREKDEAQKAHIAPLGGLAAEIEAARLEINSLSMSASDGGNVVIARERFQGLNQLRMLISEDQAMIDRIVGNVHDYVSDRYQELRFGSSVESSFEVLRSEVDRAILALVPDLIPMISSAFENAGSENPEDWQAAAATCRRLLMTAADRLRPAGQEKNGIKMGPGNYVNRLIDWISEREESTTRRNMIDSDLEYLGKRLDAADSAGHKGAHVGKNPVTKLEASRYVTGSYLVLGDILQLDATQPNDG